MSPTPEFLNSLPERRVGSASATAQLQRIRHRTLCRFRVGSRVQVLLRTRSTATASREDETGPIFFGEK